LPIIVVSFRKFRGKKPVALCPVNAHNRMRSHVMAGQKRVEDARERAYARPSTPLMPQGFEDVDARDKPGMTIFELSRPGSCPDHPRLDLLATWAAGFI
jgi:hypothetical protein